MNIANLGDALRMIAVYRWKMLLGLLKNSEKIIGCYQRGLMNKTTAL